MATTADVRLYNRVAVLRSIASHGSVARSQIGADCKMSQATVGRILEELRKENLVVLEAPPKSNGLNAGVAIGRPIRNVRLDQSFDRFLLIEVGIRETRMTTSPADITYSAEWTVSFATPSTAGQWKAAFAASYAELNLIRRPDAVAISLPGVVDESNRRVMLSPNLHWAESVDFEKEIQLLVGSPVRIIQESRALALGHTLQPGAPRSFLLVDFGTGLGAAAIIDGKPYKGALPLAGEIGHIPIVGNQRPCGCGGRGCLETLLGRSYLLDNPDGMITFEEIRAGILEHGIPTWLSQRIGAAAHCVAAALNLLGLNRVILTGYVSDLPPIVVELLERGISSSSLWARFGQVHVETAQRQRRAGLAAAAFDLMLEGIPRSETSAD